MGNIFKGVDISHAKIVMASCLTHFTVHKYLTHLIYFLCTSFIISVKKMYTMKDNVSIG